MLGNNISSLKIKSAMSKARWKPILAARVNSTTNERREDLSINAQGLYTSGLHLGKTQKKLMLGYRPKSSLAMSFIRQRKPQPKKAVIDMSLVVKFHIIELVYIRGKFRIISIPCNL